MNADPNGQREPGHRKEDLLPETAQVEREAIISQIHQAFQDVAREGGISWSECEAIDNWASEEECELARRSDRDKSWWELVDDLEWQPFPSIGGFSFIDPIGFRYYLPPTMIRLLRGEASHWFPEHFPGVINSFAPWHPRRVLDKGDDLTDFWSTEQERCIARFMAFMSRHDPLGGGDTENMAAWAAALKSGWYWRLELDE